MDIVQTKTYTVAEFCERAKTLLQSEDIVSFVRFVLCGYQQDHQVVIDPIQDRLEPGHKISGLRDFDSLLGIDRDICVHSSLTLFPLAKKEDTLRTNLHLDYSFQIPGVSGLGSKFGHIFRLIYFSSTVTPFPSIPSLTSALRSGQYIT